jgi:hypothetical protein
VELTATPQYAFMTWCSVKAQVQFTFYLLPYSMDWSPTREADRRLAAQEIPCLLWNPKIHYRVHKNPPLDSDILSGHK